MVDSLADIISREFLLTNSDVTNGGPTRSWHSQLLTRKVSDGPNGVHHTPSLQHTPTIMTTDHSNPSAVAVTHVADALFQRKSLDASYDTDGGVGLRGTTHQHRVHSNNNYDYLLSPRLPPRRATPESSKTIARVSLQRLPSHKTRHNLAPSDAANTEPNGDRDGDQFYEGDARRRHIRFSRRVHHPPPAAAAAAASPHNLRIMTSSPRHGGKLAAAGPGGPPMRLIFMRHSERANQALGPDWYNRAFRGNVYQSYDDNLPQILPKRHNNSAYEFDAPLTVRGLKNARLTGRAMANNNILVDICLSSTSLRCVQTCERVLTGMDRRDQIPIRIEPGLFECPHLNYKLLESFMSKSELAANRYNIKNDYKSLISKVTVPESLEEYFERCSNVMRGIVERYCQHGETVLIVTHAPGLLALTDALRGARPNPDTFYRTVSGYPPLAITITEFDGIKWKMREVPFDVTAIAQQAHQH